MDLNPYDVKSDPTREDDSNYNLQSIKSRYTGTLVWYDYEANKLYSES